MVLNLGTAKKELISKQQSYILEWGYCSVFLKPYGMSSIFYILQYYVFLFFIFMSLSQWIVAKQNFFALYFDAKGNPNICNSMLSCVW